METTYRQLTQLLRWRNNNRGPWIVSERPMQGDKFTDTTDAPTLVTFREGDGVNIDWLLKIGAIEPLPSGPPAVAKPKVPVVVERVAESGVG